MTNNRNRIHLKKMLNCIGNIENYCTDLTEEQLLDDEFRTLLYRNLNNLGIEAAHVDIKHPSIFTLRSFEKADYINGLGKDVYAIFNFVVNDLEYLKNSIASLCLGRKRTRTAKNNYAVA